jgi:tetratricopeptide (TPR) repeat protein
VIEIPLMSHENHPSLILKTRVKAIKNLQEFIATIQRDGTLEREISISNILDETVAAWGDFKLHGNLERLDQAISNWRTVIKMTPENEPNLPSFINNLATSLQARFEQLGRPVDINEAIDRLQSAIYLTPDDDQYKLSRLNHLGAALVTRFQQLGNLEDLEKAIAQLKAAVDITPEGHPEAPSLLNNLGTSLQKRFERFGNPVDIDEAIARREAAVNIVSSAHPDKPMFLCNLGSSFQERFDLFGNITDIDEAIGWKQRAVYLTPDDHPHKPMFLSSLGISFNARFYRFGEISDINSAIKWQQKAVNLTRDGHPAKFGRMSNLGSAFQSRFQRLGDILDLRNAIEQHRQVVDRTPDSEPHKPIFLNNLGNSINVLFRRFGNIADIDEAILHHQAAVKLIQDDHPNKPMLLNALGEILMERFKRLHQTHDAEMAALHFSAAATSAVGPPLTRFTAAEQWISVAPLIDPQSLLAAFKCALDLMPLVAWLGLPIADRHQHLVKIGGLARDAAAAAISLEEYEKALEWLEQGRSIVWTQILQLRTPVDHLRDVSSGLAERLLQVSRLLDHGTQKDDFSTMGQTAREEESRRYRALTAEWESITEQVRSLPGFEDFLRPPRVSRLKDAAKDGPVVVLNIAESRCDALALLPGYEEVVHIPLPNISSRRVTELRDKLKDQLYSNGIRMRDTRVAMKATDEDDNETCEQVLAEVWDNLVKPVIDSLAFSVRSIISHKSILLTTSFTASSRCTSADLVVCHRTACFPPDPCSWHIWFGIRRITTHQLCHIIIYSYFVCFTRVRQIQRQFDFQSTVGDSIVSSWCIFHP